MFRLDKSFIARLSIRFKSKKAGSIYKMENNVTVLNH